MDLTFEWQGYLLLRNEGVPTLTPEALEALLHHTILPRVDKPGRYLGNEHNIIQKSWDRDLTRIALAFPDVYDTAMPYNGFQILYHILNREEDIAAERVYAPWPDMEAEMRAQGLPLYGLESKHPLSEFDIIGFSLPYDLLYTNILNMLDLGRIPIWSRDRTADDPFVIAGGTNAYNPEPVADFFDLVFIGDAEEAIVDLVRIIGEGRRAGHSRTEILAEAAKLPQGVYVPQFYDVTYNNAGQVTAVKPNHPDISDRVKSAKIPFLEADNYPIKPVLPLIDIAQDRFALEVFRGCTQGCRFCHAGMVYRPVRERPPEDLIRQAKATLEATGQKNMALLSLSTSDYTGLGETMIGLQDYLQARKVSVSLPSMRLDSFTGEIADYARQQKKSGLTFAPEAGTWRMRRVINKLISEEDLHESVQIALDGGWKTLKFYFMLGLPTETEADLQGIIDLIKGVREQSQGYGGVQINVTLSTFIPKPETPFQWEAQDDRETIREKIRFLMDGLRLKRVKASYRDPAYSAVEGILSRGDRRLAAVIHRAWRDGAVFDSWGDFFEPDRWMTALEVEGLTLDHYLRERSADEVLPWDHVDNGLLKKFLHRERRNAYREATVIDCRDGCLACGVCDFEKLTMRTVKEGNVTRAPSTPDDETRRYLERAAEHIKAPPTSYELPPTIYTARLRYAKTGLSAYLGHLDVQRAFLRAISLADLPMVYSQGFNRRPRLSAGPALPLGYTSDVEYMDLLLASDFDDLPTVLNPHLPAGIRILEANVHDHRLVPLAGTLAGMTHRVRFETPLNQNEIQEMKAALLRQQNVYITRTRKKREIRIDLLEYIDTIDIEAEQIRITTRIRNGMGVRMNEILPALLKCSPKDLPPHRVHRESVTFTQEDPQAAH